MATLKCLRPQDVLWDARAVVLPGRQKGRGTRPKTVPLTYDGLKALQRFDELECWGNFSSASMWSSFQRACESLGIKGVRPYDLRHSFGTALYAATGDVQATKSSF